MENSLVKNKYIKWQSIDFMILSVSFKGFCYWQFWLVGIWNNSWIFCEKIFSETCSRSGVDRLWPVACFWTQAKTGLYILSGWGIFRRVCESVWGWRIRVHVHEFSVTGHSSLARSLGFWGCFCPVKAELNIFDRASEAENSHCLALHLQKRFAHLSGL